MKAEPLDGTAKVRWTKQDKLMMIGMYIAATSDVVVAVCIVLMLLTK